MSGRGPVSRVMCVPENVSVIYLCLRLPARYSSLPLDNGRAVLSCRYIWPCNPQDVRRLMSPCGPVVSYTRLFTLTLSPKSQGGCFLSLIPDIAASFPLKNAVPCVARTFLYGLFRPERQTVPLHRKVTIKFQNRQMSGVNAWRSSLICRFGVRCRFLFRAE